MKTIKFFSVLSLTLIFLGITSGFSGKIETFNAKNIQGPVIRYQVIIHPGFNTAPCTPYLVKVMDEHGNLVAPPQRFVPGNDKYVFNERFSPVGNSTSRRVAMLVGIPFPDHFTCANPLSAIPDVKVGPFLTGQTYSFDLYIKNQPQDN
jgi:hypothetical protein